MTLGFALVESGKVNVIDDLCGCIDRPSSFTHVIYVYIDIFIHVYLCLYVYNCVSLNIHAKTSAYRVFLDLSLTRPEMAFFDKPLQTNRKRAFHK